LQNILAKSQKKKKLPLGLYSSWIFYYDLGVGVVGYHKNDYRLLVKIIVDFNTSIG